MLSNWEKKLFKKGYKKIAGIDEVGRGCLAGPVCAAAVVLRQAQGLFSLKKIRDSKQLSEKQREEVFEQVKDNPAIEWQISYVWPNTIDKINIWQATLLAWKRSLKKLKTRPDFLFLDGNQQIPNLKITQQAVVKGDEKIFVLSLASIIAKVSRDRLMKKLHQKYPQYGLARHKGYGTKLHFAKLNRHGCCIIHRKSFSPVFANLSFKEKVFYIVSQIPKGQVLTYKQVAQTIGYPKAFRAVGNVLNKNYNPKIPCHRVIRSNGRLGGYNKGQQIKKDLLSSELTIVDKP